MDEIPIIEAKIGNGIYHFQDPGLKEIEFQKAMEENHTSFRSKIGNDIVTISVWTTPKRTKTYPFPRVYNTLGYDGKKITIIPVQASYGKYGDDNILQPGTMSWMTGLGVYVIIGVYTKAKKKAKGAPSANAKIGKLSTQGKAVFTNFEFDSDDLEEQIRKIVSKCPKIEDWNQEQLCKIPSLLELAIVHNRRLGQELQVTVRTFKSLEKKLVDWKINFPKYLEDSDKKSKAAQHREFASTQILENVPGSKGKINVDMGNSKMIFLTGDSVMIDKKKKIVEVVEGKHSTEGKFPSENDVLDALFKLMIFRKSDFSIDGEKYGKKLVCYLSGIGTVTNEEIKEKYKRSIQECKNNNIEFRFNNKVIN